MLEPTNLPHRDADIEVQEQFLDDLMTAYIDGLRAARAVADGGPPDAGMLHEYAQALEIFRIGVLRGGPSASGFLEPTEDDVRNARHLVQLVREGAPSEALVEPARRAARVVTDGWDLERFQSALFCLEDEASRIQHIERIQEVLDLTIALFERGCRAASFVSTPLDIANVRRLREVAAADGAEALAERMGLVKELQARLPRSGSDAARFLYLKR
jgi:hypothetical protein